MVFSPIQLTFSLKELEAGDLECFRGWSKGALLDCPSHSWQWGWVQKEVQSQCFVVLPLMLLLGQHPSTSVLRLGNLVLYLSTKYPGESLEMDFCRCRTHMCKLNTFFSIFSHWNDLKLSRATCGRRGLLRCLYNCDWMQPNTFSALLLDGSFSLMSTGY